MAQLTELLAGFAPWQQALSLLDGRQVAALYDMTESQRAFAAASLAAQTGRLVLYVAASEQAALRAAEDAAPLLQGRAALLPAPDLQFLRAVSGREQSFQRLSVLGRAQAGELQLVSVSAETLLSRWLPPALWQQAAFTVREGEEHDPLRLVARLTAMGYERVPMVEGKGQCALLGDILNIFPPEQDEAVRVEFFDTQIDSIRTFDPLTQRSTGRLTALRLGPAAEVFLPEDRRQAAMDAMLAAIREGQAALPLLKQRAALPDAHTSTVSGYWRLLRDAEQLGETGSFPGMELWTHLLFPDAGHLADLLDDPLVVVDTPDRVLGRLNDRTQGYAEDLNQALLREDAVPTQQHLLYTPDEVLDRLKRQPVLLVQELLRGMAGLTPQAAIPFAGQGLSRYQNRFRELAGDVRAWSKEGWSIAVLCGGASRADRMQRGLNEHDCFPVRRTAGDHRAQPGEPALMELAFSRGFLMEEARLLVVCDSDVFGSAHRKQRAAKSAGAKIDAFTDLSVGDYVVHEHHGIGIYQGTVRLQSEGAWRDYLFIQYRDNDKLYVPLDQFDRVQKYIGAGDNAPSLNDLGSGDWLKARKKVKAGLQKLAFDLVQLYAQRQSEEGHAFPPQDSFEGQFGDQFEYELTPDQQQAVTEVLGDMEKPVNMDRLLCGDVGYGKTEVALRAAFRAVMDGKQVALLAPTTILVQQHYRTILKRFESFPIKAEFVSRFRSAKQNRETLLRAARGEIDILVGTHRLLSKDAKFKDLGLLIVDEEQRFGVGHKESIKNLKRTVDVLTLSATPIPRTLHMSMLGVRDLSLLETPPEERFPVQTYVVDYSDALIRDAILRETNRQGQVFFLYNRVADIDRFAGRLRQLVPEVSIAIAHGQMQEGALEDVMMDFVAGRYDVLLCSTIIENGIDIPRANTLIVFDADRFGLSQLYQLRGRVGRSNRAAYAYFTVRADKTLSETAEKRLAAIKEFTEFGSGFRIAMRDLSIRGAGNILGPEQSGQVSQVGYDLYCKLIEEAVREAKGDFSAQRERDLETRVELHVSAYLPEKYVQGEAQRMEVYKRIAGIRSQEEKGELIDELIDRFGEPEDSVLNLMDVSLLRGYASRLGAEFVNYANGALKFRLSPQFVVDPSLLYQGMVQTDRRFTMQSGKKPALLLVLGEVSPAQALREGIRAMEKLLAFVGEQEKIA